MADKDISEKILMRHADVFADCGNALMYGGEQRLRAENDYLKNLQALVLENERRQRRRRR